MNPTIESAAIGASVAVATIIIRDLGLPIWQTYRSEAKEATSIFHIYADPLAASSESLLWRLREALSDEGRGVYLRADCPTTDYCLYKKLSTQYRIASLIAWIRAIKREQSFIPLRYKKSNSKVEQAIKTFEDALAQGENVEAKRLHFLCELWNVPLPSETEQRRIAITLDHCIQNCRATFKESNNSTVSENEMEVIVRSLAQCLADNISGTSLKDVDWSQSAAKAYECYSLREAWLYREWQAGIGDMMLVEILGRTRRFDTISYGDFESLATTGNDKQKVWMRRLNALIDDIDVLDINNHRTQQLRNCYISSARIVCSIDSVLKSKSVFSTDTLDLAKRVASVQFAAIN